MVPLYTWRHVTVPHTRDAFTSLGAHLQFLQTWTTGNGVSARVRQRLVVGDGMCGHPGVVHGGIVALLMDDTMGVLVSTATTNDETIMRQGVTASLQVSYKQPCPTGVVVELEASYERLEGRKHFLECELRTGNSLLSTGHSLYLLPKDSIKDLDPLEKPSFSF